MLQIATLSGMGKTAFGITIMDTLIEHIESRLIPTPTKIGTKLDDVRLNNPAGLLNVLRNAKRVFVDFNGGGDALTGLDFNNPENIIGPRLAARGLLAASVANAREDPLFLQSQSSLKLPAILSELFRQHRLEKRLADDDIALLFVHIDEYQLARQQLLANDIKDDVMKAQLLPVVGVGPQTGNDFAMLLLTGTARAGLAFLATQHPRVDVPLQPLQLKESLALLASTKRVHESWFLDEDFRRFVGDLGGSPRLVLAAAESCFQEPPDDVTSTLWRASTQIEPVIPRLTMPLPYGTVVSFARLVLSQQPVLPSQSVGNGMTVDSLAQEGIVTMAPHPDPARAADGCVVVHSPIAVIARLLPDNPLYGPLFKFPFSRGDGSAFELAVAFSLSARLSKLKDKLELLNEVLGLPSSAIHRERATTQLPELGHVRGPANGDVPIVRDTHQVMRKNQCIYQLDEPIPGLTMWTQQTISTTLLTQGMVALHCGGTFAFDMRMVFDGLDRPMALFAQFKDRKDFKVSHTADAIVNGMELLDQLYGDRADLVFIVMTPARVGEKSANNFLTLTGGNLRSSKRAARRTLLLMTGSAVRKVVPYFWHRVGGEAMLDDEQSAPGLVAWATASGERGIVSR